MKKIGVLVFLVPIFLLYPFFDSVYAQNISPSFAVEETLLSPLERNILFGLIQQEFTNSDFYLWDIEKQAALFSVRVALRDKNISFLPGFVATETIKIVLKSTNLLVGLKDISLKELLNKVESKTVEEAVKIGTDWLFQNNIKRASGNLSDEMQYIMAIDSSRSRTGQLVLEVFSSNYTDPPSGGAGWGYTNPYPGLPKGERLRPFVLRFRIDTFYGERIEFLSAPNIEISFPEKVPVLKLAKELPYPLEEQKIKLLNYWTTAKKILEYLRSTGSETLGKAADFAHKAQEVVESLINRTSQLLSKGGAGLIVETQLNLVKGEPTVDIKSQQFEDEAKPVENLAELSFPRDEKFDPVKARQEILALKSILSQVKDELNPIQQETKQEMFVENLTELSFLQEQPILDSIKEDEAKLNSIKDIAEEKPVASSIVWCAIDPSRGPGLSTVVFSEIAWMGSVNSANDEWMKLKNISNSEVSIAGWQLQDKDSQIQIAFGQEHSISSQGLFVLERTNDDSLLGTQAHVIYTGALNNTNEVLYLFDEKCILRDKVVAGPDWLAGDSASRKPMERGSDLSWHTLGVVQIQATSLGQPAQIISGSIAPPPPPVITYPKILISEIQIAGETTKDEFIELYNSTGEAVNLAGWSLKRKTSTGSDVNLVSAGAFSGTIGAYGYFLIVPQPNDDGTTNYKGSATPDLFYSGQTYSIASDNIIFLYNPNGELSDKVGFGAATEAEDSPAPNPPAGQSLNRIWDATNQTYYDSDNNFIDFSIHNPTSPKAVNPPPPPPPPLPPPLPPPPPPPPSPSPPAQDTTPPQATFSSLAASQTNVSFSLSWTATDPAGDVSPSGVQYIYLEYSVAPSATGVFVQYQNNGVWTDWQQGATGKLILNPETTTLNLLAQDGVSYTFQIKAKDVAGNESTANNASTAVSLARTVVINEVAWAGTKAESTDEWLELLNTTSSLIDLTGWKIKSSDTLGPEITLLGTIAANGFYLIERTDDLATTTAANLTASFGNGLSNTSCEVFSLYNSQDTAVDQSACKDDGTWSAGTASPDYISMERIVATNAGSSESNWASNNLIKYNGKDAANPANWINGTPGATNSTATSPTTITELRFNEFSTITLTLLGSPYITTAGIMSITVPAAKTLIVEPGVTVKFGDNRGKLTVQGTLKAQGTQANGITFTVDAGAIWCGIKVASTSTASQLDYVTIDKAQSIGSSFCNENVNYAMYVDTSAVTINNSVIQTGSYHRKLYLKNSNSTINAVTISGATLNADSVGIYIDGGRPTISNSIISNNSIGIFVNSLSNNPTIQNSTFTGNTYAVKLESAGALLSGNSAANNTYNGIFFEGAISSNTTWQADTIPYIVNKFTVSAEKTLTLQAGVVVKFVNIYSAETEITVQGTLITQGTKANPVMFTGITNTTTWKRIYIAPGSTGSQLTYTTLKYGGNTYYEAALYVKQSSVQVSNLTISNSVQSAIFSLSGTITGSGVTLSNNTYGFHIQLGDCPTLINVTITGTVLHPSSVLCSF